MNRPLARLYLFLFSTIGLTAALLQVLSSPSAGITCGTTCKDPTLRVADGGSPEFALIYIADALGFFKQEELKVVFTRFTTGRDALRSILQGESDIATALVARRDHGIVTPQDLRGKKIALARNTNAEFFTDSLLKENQLKASDITILDVPRDKLLTLLKNGAVSGIVGWGPERAHADSAPLSFVTFQLEGAWLFVRGEFNGPIPSFRDMLFPEYLEAIRPEAVTVLNSNAEVRRP